MRRLLLVLLALLMPVAAATEPTDPYVFDAALDADPAVGTRVTLTVSVEARRALDAPLRLDVPAWVDVEGPLEWHAQVAEGETAEHAWRLVATRAGFWRAGLAVDASRADAYAQPVEPARAWHPVAGCCIFAWSTDGRGIWSENPGAAVPAESTVGFHPSFRARDAEHAELVVRMSPQDRRYAGQELVLQAPLGATELQRAPADAPAEFVHVFALAPGEGSVVSAAGFVRVTFEGGEHADAEAAWSQPVACANLQVAREGDEVRETGRWGCEAAPARGRPIPAAPALVAAFLALAARSAYPRSLA